MKPGHKLGSLIPSQQENGQQIWTHVYLFIELCTQLSMPLLLAEFLCQCMNFIHWTHKNLLSTCWVPDTVPTSSWAVTSLSLTVDLGGHQSYWSHFADESNWGPESWNEGHAASKWWSWDIFSGSQMPVPKFDFLITLTSVCCKLQDLVLKPLLGTQEIHTSGLFTSSFLQGLQNWPHRIQYGLGRNQVPDNTVGHSPPVFSLMQRIPHCLGLRLWIQTNTSQMTFTLSLPTEWFWRRINTEATGMNRN